MAFKGRRSPRWALWARLEIPCKDGLLYLARLRIIQTPWFGVYLHDIHEPDGDRDPHNHPWSFLSIVLRGSYTEVVHPYPELSRDTQYQQHWRRFSIHRMGRSSAHRIVHLDRPLKTLLLVGPRRHSWGFFTHDGYRDWSEYKDVEWEADKVRDRET